MTSDHQDEAILIQGYNLNNKTLPGGGGGGGGRGVRYLFPCSSEIFKNFPLFPKIKILNFLCSLLPKIYICYPDPFIFRLVFPCSPEKIHYIPVLHNSWEGLKNLVKALWLKLHTIYQRSGPSSFQIRRFLKSFLKSDYVKQVTLGAEPFSTPGP